MSRRGLILIRAGDATHRMSLASRDIRLLDGQYFFKDGWAYRKLFALDFFRGLKAPQLGVILATHQRSTLVTEVRRLLTELETQRDLISRDYLYGFESEKYRPSGG